MGKTVYPFKEIEERHRSAWVSRPKPSDIPDPLKKHMVLPLPGPSRDGPCTFTEMRRFVVADTHARLQKLLRNEMAFPLTWNGFASGIEARAKDSGTHPAEAARKQHDELVTLLARMGIGHDAAWEVELQNPEAYRWAQWVFLELFKRGLAQYKRGLAPGAEESSRDWMLGVRDGRWIIDFASLGDRLLNDLDRTNWPLQEKRDQRYRIGRRRGSEVIFQVSHAFRMEFDELPVFTTQVEAIYGATFILIDPRHPILPSVLDPSYEDDVARYRDRLAKGGEPRISGQRTGGFAFNPVNLRRIPVLVSALAMDPLTGGAILGMPAHDPDLFALAQRSGLQIKEAIRGPGARYDVKGNLKEAYLGDGTLTNSSIFSGLPVRVARERIINHLARRGSCSRTTRFRIQEVPASIAGTWGIPIPMIHCSRCGAVAVPEETLPVPPQAGGPASGGAARTEGAGERSMLSTGHGQAMVKLPKAICPSCSGDAVRDPHLLAPWMAEALGSLICAAGGRIGDAVVLAAPGECGPTGGAPPAAEAAQGSGGQEGPAPGALQETDPTAHLFDNDPLGMSDDGTPEGSGPVPAVGPSGSGGPPAVARETKDPINEDLLFPEDRDIFPSADYKASAADPEEDKESVDSPRPGPEVPAASREAPAGEALESSASGPAVTSAEEEEEEEEIAPPPPVESRFHPFRQEGIHKWLPADAAFGRADQGVLFLLLMRALTKFLNEIGEIPFQEPFYRYLRMGPVELPPEPEKKPAGSAKPIARPGPGPGPGPGPAQSKRPASRGITPQEALGRYGSDALRIALIGLGPPQMPARMDERRLHHAQRFLDRIWRQVTVRLEKGKFISKAVLEAKHHLIHDALQRLKRFKFHTALASLHGFINFLKSPSTALEEMDRNALRTLLIVLWPFAPHLAEELWRRIGEQDSLLSGAVWPEANKEILRPLEKEIPVRIDGRILHRLRVPTGLDKEKLEALVLKDEKVQAAIAGRSVRRAVTVVDRVVNLLIETAGPKAETVADSVAPASVAPTAHGTPQSAAPAVPGHVAAPPTAASPGSAVAQGLPAAGAPRPGAVPPGKK